MAPVYSTAGPSTSPPPTLRPMTFFTTLPRQVSFKEDILAILTLFFSQGVIRGIKDYQGGEMEVHFKTMQGVEILLAEPVLKLHDHVDEFCEYRGVRTHEVRVAVQDEDPHHRGAVPAFPVVKPPKSLQARTPKSSKVQRTSN